MHFRLFIYCSLILITIAFSLQSCGNPTISFNDDEYEANIAIEGFLIPGKSVEKIYVWKNFPSFKNVESLALPNAEVTITDLKNENTYQLYFNTKHAYFEYLGNDLEIKSGNSYRLDVTAVINGKTYISSSATTVPKTGLNIIGISEDSLSYRQRNPKGELQHFKVDFERLPGIDLYLVTLTALDATTVTFIYNNPFSDAQEEDVQKDLNALRFNYEWLQDLPRTEGITNFEIFWYHTNFYGKYELIIFAVDKNWGDFLQTYNDVQEPDGNFHEPIFHFEGKGVGVFGSAVADTIFFTVTP